MKPVKRKWDNGRHDQKSSQEVLWSLQEHHKQCPLQLDTNNITGEIIKSSERQDSNHLVVWGCPNKGRSWEGIKVAEAVEEVERATDEWGG